MKMLNKTLMTLAAAALSAGAAQAGLTGAFTDQGGGLYYFEVTNTDLVNYNVFNLSFTGDFKQGFGAGVATAGSDLGGLAFAQLDTFIHNNVDGAEAATAFLNLGISETLTSLSGNFGYGGGRGIAPGETEILAIFNVNSGTPELVSASGNAGAGDVTIDVVPEPGSLALLGLGGLLIARRRRA